MPLRCLGQQSRFWRFSARRLVLLALLLPLAALAAPESQAPAVADMEARLALYEAANAEDGEAARLAEIYRGVVANLHNAVQNREQLAEQQQQYLDAPARLSAAVLDLKNLQRQARSATGMAQTVAISRLERLLRDNRERLQQLHEREQFLQSSVQEMSGDGERARHELKAILDAGDLPKPAALRASESEALQQARMDDWRARTELGNTRQALLESDIRTLPDRLAAAQAELKLVVAQRDQTESFLGELLGLDVLKRIRDAEQLREQVLLHTERAVSVHPDVVALKQEVVRLADEFVSVVSSSESTAAELVRASATQQELGGAYNSIRQQLSIDSLNEALGPVLMEHYLKLEQFDQPARKLQRIAGKLATTRLRQFQVGELVAAELQTRERIYRSVESTETLGGVEWRNSERGAAVAESDLLMNDRNTVLDALNQTYLQAADQLVELDSAYRDQAGTAADFRQLLDRNLIWMKSHRQLNLADIMAWPRQVWTMLAQQGWRKLGVAIGGAASVHAFDGGAVVLGCLLLALYRKRLRAVLTERSLRTVGWAQYRFRYALQSVGIHLLLALPIPLVLLGLGWVAAAIDGSGSPAAALSTACYSSAQLAYGYLLLLFAHRPDGFARQHLRWKRARVQAVERWLRLGILALLPVYFFAAFSEQMSRSLPAEQAYRINGLLAVSLFFLLAVQVSRSSGGMFDRSFFAHRYPSLGRLAQLLLGGAIAIQPFIVILDALGYHFTAAALRQCTLLTVMIMLLAKMVIDAGLLGITLAARRSLAAQVEQVETADSGDGVAPARNSEIGEDVDLKSMNASAVVLLHVVVAGAVALLLVSLWRQFFTALEVLDSVGLWSYQSITEGQDTLATVSLFDLGTALLVLVSGLVLARGLPSLIGIVFYGLITQKGVLFAIQTVLGYLLAGIGVFSSLQILGFGWSKLQWLAAGLSVGLGFGLQEIFANFISGLIMLFERPVRIGDLITLGEYSGTIQRIRMRATTITDFDNREIIVPNRMFVTERLINWTLSSSVVRMNFEVGISYDADPRLAQSLLQEIMVADERILREPPPSVVFREFGASSLNFRCYYHLDDIVLRNPVQSDLHMRITELFRERGIVIAYPQLDVHLKSEGGA